MEESSACFAARADRDRYADVGRASRAFIEHLIQAEIARGEFAVTIALLHQLSLYSRLQDRIFVDRLAALTGQRHTHVARTLRKLSAAGALIYDGGKGNSASWISLDVPAPLQPPIMAAVRTDQPWSVQSDQGWSPTEKAPEQQQDQDLRLLPAESSFAANGHGQGADFVGHAETEALQTQESAAAKPEAPRETDIRQACELHRADPRVIERFARQLTRDEFAEVSERTTKRFQTSNGGISNRAAYFFNLLDAAAKERRRELEHVAERSTMPIEDEILIDARRYASARVPWDAGADCIGLKLRKRGKSESETAELLELAQRAYVTRQAELAAPEEDAA